MHGSWSGKLGLSTYPGHHWLPQSLPMLLSSYAFEFHSKPLLWLPSRFDCTTMLGDLLKTQTVTFTTTSSRYKKNLPSIFDYKSIDYSCI